MPIIRSQMGHKAHRGLRGKGMRRSADEEAVCRGTDEEDIDVPCLLLGLVCDHVRPRRQVIPGVLSSQAQLRGSRWASSGRDRCHLSIKER